MTGFQLDTNKLNLGSINSFLLWKWNRLAISNLRVPNITISPRFLFFF